VTAPKLAQSKSGRHYTWPPNADDPDLVVPSVTTILNELNKPALMPWAAKMVAEYAVTNRDKWTALDDGDAIDLLKGSYRRHTFGRADIGTAAHNAIEAHIKEGLGQPTDVEPELVPYVAAALRFLDDFNVEPIHVEATVFNAKYQYAGTADLFATIQWNDDKHVAVIDWKTKEKGKRLYEEVALQLGALASGEWVGTHDGEEHEMPTCTAGLAVALYDDATYKVWPVDLAKYGPRIFKTFTALRTLHAWSASYKSLVLDAPIKGAADL